MLKSKNTDNSLNSAAYPLQLFSIGFILLQTLNIYEWLWEIQPNLNTIYLVYAMVATAFKFDLVILGIALSIIYEKKPVEATKISENVKVTVKFFYILGGFFTLVQLIITVLAMHQYTFSVLWTMLLLMVGQSMLEVIIFTMMLFFSLLVMTQYEAQVENNFKALKDIEEASLILPAKE